MSHPRAEVVDRLVTTVMYAAAIVVGAALAWTLVYITMKGAPALTHLNFFTEDMRGVQWGKLIVNLNNALNALSGLPLREQLAQRPWRALFADQMTEGLVAIRAEGISPVSPTPIPPAWMPPLLRLPDGIFGLLLGRTMQIDPAARSSMWEDLQRGRRTEIDYLQGVITAIADRHGLKAPLSRRVVGLIRQAEAAGQGSPALTPAQVRP